MGYALTRRFETQFVKQLAAGYKLPFLSQRLELGAQASEELARQQRYASLYKLADQVEAAALICGHHQDDFLETVVLNFIRGCHRRGLVSLQSQARLLRPLLPFPKQTLLDYAQTQQLAWLEDASNHSLRYLRNRIRQRLMPRLTVADRQALLQHCQQLIKTNQALDAQLRRYLQYKSYRRQGQVFARPWFNSLDHLLASEIVSTWLFEAGLATSRKQINYIVVKLKTLSPGKIVVVNPQAQIELTKRSIRLRLASSN